ncbi:hypothetical protein [Xanthomonas maliensis]|uniref:hypothetical protein n=1 Tax=Xanthomonas maliensis TaxID=1321368 RepID=UPI001264EB68|nr:hypothetical protein [Xanthomonas maliensis]KAB7763913.1 hypothetical protein CKY51_18760 [Xanthomonas maliensis]
MKITITDTRVTEKNWQKGDRSGVIRTQEAMAETRKFRQTVRLDLGKEPAYEPGIYELDLEENVSVGDFGDFKLARKPTLVRVDKPAAASQPPVKAA